MKKRLLIILVLTVALILTLLTSCGNQPNNHFNEDGFDDLKATELIQDVPEEYSKGTSEENSKEHSEKQSYIDVTYDNDQYEAPPLSGTPDSETATSKEAAADTSGKTVPADTSGKAAPADTSAKTNPTEPAAKTTPANTATGVTATKPPQTQTPPPVVVIPPIAEITTVTEKPQPAESYAFALPYKFTASDIYGNTVTEKTLGEKEVYFIHYWATWCGPCVNEMKDLAKLAQNYSDRVGFIGLIGDYDSNLKGAKKIVESAGIPDSFIMLNANDSSVKSMLDLVKSGYFPTTACLFKNGSKVEESILVGAYGAKYSTYLDTPLSRG